MTWLRWYFNRVHVLSNSWTINLIEMVTKGLQLHTFITYVDAALLSHHTGLVER